MTALPKTIFTIFTFSFLLMFVQSANSQCEMDNSLKLKDFELKNRVKKVVTHKTPFEKDKQTGLLVKGNPEIENEKLFDAQGNSNVYRGTEKNKVKVKREYKIRSICDSGRRISLVKYIFEDGTSLDAEIYKYDESGRLLEKSAFSTDGILTDKEIFVFDEKGNLLEKRTKEQVHPEHFRPERYDIYVNLKYVYKYDDRNNLVEEKAFRGEDSLYSTEIYQYNSGNKLIKHSIFDNQNNLKDQYFYKYQGENAVEKIHYQNLCIGKACDGQINSGDGLFLYALKENYKYDSKGNWIEKSESRIGLDENQSEYELEAIYTRKITYYKD